jgi:tRNA pseudouridine38-40 synthase
VERRVRIDLAYDGTAYAGWQLQPGSGTVQAVVEEALCRIHGGRAVRLRAAGRTDSGAHARGQVADGLVATRYDDGGLLRALAHMLPEDVRPRRVLTVAPSFHAQHDAKSKTYRYLIDTSATGDPWRRRYALAFPRSIDDRAVDAALALVPGTRDWSGFAGSACRVEDRVRTIAEARRIGLRPDLQAFVFTADGFLTHMVRNLVGTLLEIGRLSMEPERIEEVLSTRDRKRAGPTAPAKGLCLMRVVYDAASVTDLAHQLGFFETIGSWRAYDDVMPRLAAVTPEAVHEVVRRYLTPSNRTIGWFEPLTDVDCRRRRTQPGRRGIAACL